MNRSFPSFAPREPAPPLSARDFYNTMASLYHHEAEARHLFNQAIDDIVMEWIQERNVRSVLDVGCANGRRLQALLSRSGCNGIGLDVSPVMVTAATSLGISAYVADVSDSDFAERYPEFKADLVVSLWNVLGHIEGAQRRAQAMNNMCSMLAPGGTLIFDVNNRYNAPSYGWLRFLRNFARDCVFGDSGGDFLVTRSFGSMSLSTVTHLFSPREVHALVRSAGLELIEKYSIDYSTSQRRSNCWSGQLCIVAQSL